MFGRRPPKPPGKDLKPLKPAMLRQHLGAKLPFDLYDQNGKLLLPHGRNLTPAFYELVAEQPLFAGPDRPDAPASTSMTNDRRRQRRIPVYQRATLTFTDAATAQPQTHLVAITNHSATGYRITIDRPVPPGTPVRLDTGSTAAPSTTTGVARSCSTLSAGLYQVGIDTGGPATG